MSFSKAAAHLVKKIIYDSMARIKIKLVDLNMSSVLIFWLFSVLMAVVSCGM